MVEIIRNGTGLERQGYASHRVRKDTGLVLLGYASHRCKIGFPSTGGKTHVNFMCDNGFGTRLSAFAIPATPVQRSPFRMLPKKGEGAAILDEFDTTVRRPLARMGIVPSFSVLVKDARIYDRIMYMGDAIMMHVPAVPVAAHPARIMGTDEDYSGPVGLVHGLTMRTYRRWADLKDSYGAFKCGGSTEDYWCRPFLRLVMRNRGRPKEDVRYPTALFHDVYPERPKKKDLKKPMAALVEWIPNLVPLSSVRNYLGKDGENIVFRVILIKVFATLLSHMVSHIRIRDLREHHVFLKLDSLPDDFQTVEESHRHNVVKAAMLRLKPQDVRIFGFKDFALPGEKRFEHMKVAEGLWSVFTPLIEGLLGRRLEFKYGDFRTDEVETTSWLKNLSKIPSLK